MQKIKEHKKIVYGLIAGLFFSLAVAVYGADLTQNNSWNFGNGWLWFKTASNGKVRANASTPVDGSNVATKTYVDAAEGGSASGKVIVFRTKGFYNGEEVGGFAGADSKCSELIPGAVMVRNKIIYQGDWIYLNNFTESRDGNNFSGIDGTWMSDGGVDNDDRYMTCKAWVQNQTPYYTNTAAIAQIIPNNNSNGFIIQRSDTKECVQRRPIACIKY